VYGDTVLRRSRVFGLLRQGRKANSKEAKRENERTLEHAELKTKSH
jgi:hypothetical protein